MLASALAGARLKKVERPKDPEQAPRVTLCDNEEAYRRMMEETYFEEYWEKIKDYSFTSAFVPLSVEAAQALRDAHQQWLASNKQDKGAWKQNFPILMKVAEDITRAQRELNRDNIFVRLSSRSPKDAALSREGFKDILAHELEQVKVKEGEAATSHTNQLLHALYRASTVALKVANGEEGVQLLVESPRIQGDLEDVVSKQKNDFNIIVREWGDFDVDLEFRAFVYKGKFTALTQYNEFIYFPTMVAHKDAIAEQVSHFINEKLVPIISLPNFVIDFALKYPTDEGGEYKIYVVEINPFAEFAGSGLFTWTEDMDILLGKKPFKFRTHTSEPPFAAERVAKNWIVPEFMQTELHAREQ
jgi:hypothetical protein